MQVTPDLIEREKILCDRYCLKQKLGENTVRQTWLANDLKAIDSENSQVIVKLLCFGGQNQWEQLKLFEGEAQVLKQLNYPYIPKYRDYFWIDDRFLWFGLVEDYIPGTSLADLLAGGKKFTEQQVRQIAIALLNILIYLHELHPPVLHKDIKPSNLIWDGNQQLYVVDFGIRDKVCRSGGTFTVVGTYGYTPIEQFSDRAVLASDLYALGATLIHLLTGTSPADLPQKDLRIQFRDRAYVNPDLVAWIERLTEPDLAKRFSNAQEAMKSLMSDASFSSEHNKNNQLLSQTLPEKLAKPPYTRVKLTQTSHQIEIQMPVRGIKNLADGFRAVTCIGILVLFGSLCIIKDQFIVSLLFVLLFAPFGIPAIIFIGFLFRNTRYFLAKSVVRLNRDRAEIKKQIFGLTYRNFKIATQNIRGISVSPTDWSSQSTSITITSSSDRKQYVRCSFGSNLTEPELIWLSEEIRQWLQIAQKI